MTHLPRWSRSWPHSLGSLAAPYLPPHTTRASPLPRLLAPANCRRVPQEGTPPSPLSSRARGRSGDSTCGRVGARCVAWARARPKVITRLGPNPKQQKVITPHFYTRVSRRHGHGTNLTFPTPHPPHIPQIHTPPRHVGPPQTHLRGPERWYGGPRCGCTPSWGCTVRARSPLHGTLPHSGAVGCAV